MKPPNPISTLIWAIVGLVLVAISGRSALGQTKSETGCLSYEPTVVRLEGTLIRKTFAGPPNYESVRKGDRAETYWLLRLVRPICVDRDKKDPDVNPGHSDIRVIQLVINPQFYKTHAKLVGKHVVTTGTLAGGITGHHHTAVLLTVATEVFDEVQLAVPVRFCVVPLL